MKIFSKILLTNLVLIVIFIVSVNAHPGNTASDGCHYCRTNCDYWGVPWYVRHCHVKPDDSLLDVSAVEGRLDNASRNLTENFGAVRDSIVTSPPTELPSF